MHFVNKLLLNKFYSFAVYAESQMRHVFMQKTANINIQLRLNKHVTK